MFQVSTTCLFYASIALLILLIGLPESEAKRKRPKNMSVRAAGIILYRGVRPYQYLLLRANYPPYHWSPPKGHHEKNETDLEAAVRETEEETGYQNERDYVVNEYFKKELSYLAHGRNKTVAFFLAKMKHQDGPKMSDEHDEHKWVCLEEACEFFQHEQMEDLYHAADVHLALHPDSNEHVVSEFDDSLLPLTSDELKKTVKPGEETVKKI